MSICRLCMNENSEFLPIYDENGEWTELGIQKMIAKYFHFDLSTDDGLSNRICLDCWTTLDNFNKFCLYIEQKQQCLSQQIENENKFIPSMEGLEPEVNLVVDVKNISLTEPQIDMMLEDDDSEDTKEFAAADNCEDYDYLETLTETKYKVPRKRVRNSKGVRGRPAKKIANNEANAAEAESHIKSEHGKISRAKLIGEEMNAYIAEHIRLRCQICEEPMETFDRLKKHFRRNHNVNGYAVCCDQKFFKRIMFVDHLKLHENPDLFKCPQCKKVLTSRKNYIIHMDRLHSPEEELKFQCEICHKRFRRQYILDLHKKTHIVERNHICSACHKTFRTIEALTAHDKLVHLREFSVICDLCGKNFANKNNYEYHMNNVHEKVEQVQQQCTICGNWLKNERSLYKHMRNHRENDSGKPFVCDICGVEKNTQRALTSHIRYHHTNISYKCHLCDKQFKKGSSLEEHMATHTGKDLYTCSFCPRTFKSKANMYSHRKKKHFKEWSEKCVPQNKSTATTTTTTTMTTGDGSLNLKSKDVECAGDDLNH